MSGLEPGTDWGRRETGQVLPSKCVVLQRNVASEVPAPLSAGLSELRTTNVSWPQCLRNKAAPRAVATHNLLHLLQTVNQSSRDLT
jgi:hypothetical protein